ncbi:hypothetical protein [Pseudomonas sp. LRF_L74]|uniref:hypothetical protein n=1 Tax=Pseudomonas sp. LRF_L74 TaxID=3369422 RepID=UPI003F6162CF
MRNPVIMMLVCAGLAGCSSDGGGPDACEIFTPSEVILPTTQDDQRVEAQSSGDPTARRDAGQQHCP